jgi:hypothetical protein
MPPRNLSLACSLRRFCISILAALCLLAPQFMQSQDTEKPAVSKDTAGPSVQSDIIVEGEGPVGHFHMFTSSWWSKLYTGGVEYDRHSWDYFLKARMDYVAEVLPVTLLFQPSATDVWGDPLSKDHELTPGVALSPIGLRMMWRSEKSIKPYFLSKGGVIVFSKKAISEDAAYENLLLQLSIGVQTRVTKRLDLRTGFGYMHFSDAFIVPSNPGLDLMVYNAGVVYHLGK